MREQFLNALMAGLLVFGAGGAWAQDATPPAAEVPSTSATTAIEPPASIPAPELNVNVPPPQVDVQVQAPAAAPPSTVVVEKSEPSTHTSTNISRTETVVQPSDTTFNPWLAIGVGLAVLIVILFIAMAFADRRDHTILTGPGPGTTVTTVR